MSAARGRLRIPPEWGEESRPRPIVANFDGGLAGKLVDGVAPHTGCAAVLDGRIYRLETRYLGQGTVNTAEWSGLLLVLELVLEEGLEREDRLRIYGDSQVIVRQATGVYRVSEPRLKPYAEIGSDRIAEIRSYGCEISISHVPRERNKLADGLVRKMLDKYRG